MRLAEAEAWLEGLINLEALARCRAARARDSRSRRCRALLARLGEPERGLHVLHIAGSKGKGSTALLCEALLRAAGLLASAPSRLRISSAGRSASASTAARCRATRSARRSSALRPHVDALRTSPEPPSFFDVDHRGRVPALRRRARRRRDPRGRSRRTARLDQRRHARRQLHHEHRARAHRQARRHAGRDRRREGGHREARRAAGDGRAPAEARGGGGGARPRARLPARRLGRELRCEVLEERIDGSRFRHRDGAFEVELELAAPGRHQAANASLALACVRRSGRVDDPALRAAARAGASRRSQLPGRVEILGRAPGSSWMARTPRRPRARSPPRSRASRAGAATSCSRSPPARTSPRSARRSLPAGRRASP